MTIYYIAERGGVQCLDARKRSAWKWPARIETMIGMCFRLDTVIGSIVFG